MEQKTPLLHQFFKNHLTENKIPVSIVAENINVSKFHLGEVLKGNRVLYDSLRAKLNTYLETDF